MVFKKFDSNWIKWMNNEWTNEWMNKKWIYKIKVKMNKPVYLGLSILEIGKTLLYQFWYDYAKPKY